MGKSPRFFTADGRWRAYDYEELINRDKASLDIFWLRDETWKSRTSPDRAVESVSA
jgi:hypothetical protein